jgi:hypothetical protein
MGYDEMAVVDGEGRVHGLEGLRVVDASIMPQIITGNLNATTIMIGEKMADAIRGRQPLPRSTARIMWRTARRFRLVKPAWLGFCRAAADALPGLRGSGEAKRPAENRNSRCTHLSAGCYERKSSSRFTCLPSPSKFSAASHARSAASRAAIRYQ